MHLLTAVDELHKAVDCLQDADSEQYRQQRFVTEQLRLLMKHKYGRHYSPELAIFAFMIHAASPAAYRVLLEENVLCLPSTNTLKKVTRRLNSLTTVDNSAYLQLRVSQLNEPDRTVTFIIDEIYIAKRVEYSSGGMQVLTADGSVAIYPMDKLTAVTTQITCPTESHMGLIWAHMWAPCGSPILDPCNFGHGLMMGPMWAAYMGCPYGTHY